MSENKKKVDNKIENKGGAKKANAPVSNKANEPTEKKQIAPITIAVMITAIILVGILIAVAVVLIVDFVKKDKGFDYMKSNLSKYVEVDEDYKNFKLNVDIAKPHDIDVDVAILNLLAADKNEDPENGGVLLTKDNSENMVIGAGDIVHFWYRGYLPGENGEEIVVDKMTNFTSDKPTELGIGSGQFVSGFELGLVGVNLEDCVKFEKITSGEVKENQVAYISFSRIIGEGEDAKKTTHTNVRIDLAEDVDAEYGAGFKERLLLATVGGDKMDFNTTKDGKTYHYYDVAVTFVTECENDPIIVEVYFPYDYSQTTLRNESAIFEVYVDGFVDYKCEYEEISDEYITKKIEKKELAITLEELNEYEGNTLTEKYYDYAEKTIYSLYEEEYKDLVEETVWSHYQDIFTIKKYPVSKVEKIYEGYVDDVFEQFTTNEGKIYNNYTGSYNTYQTLDTYAPAYLGISSTSGQTWREYLYATAESLVKERLIMFYLMREEGFTPSEEDFEKLYDATRKEYVDEYIQQYLSYEGKTEADYSEEEYAKFLKERESEIFSYYDEEYFEEVTYYNIVLKNVTSWEGIEIVTLDERRAYPLDK